MIPFAVGIVGGGPAGAALAWLLARDGSRVVLVDDGAQRPPVPRETVFDSAEAPLQRLGLAELLAVAATADPCRHGAIWGRDEVQWRDSSAAGRWLHRGRCEGLLRAAAAAAGAVVVHGKVLGVDAEQGWLEVRTGTDRQRLPCKFVAVAAGRRAAPAWLPVVRVASGAPLAALTLVGHHPAAAGLAIVEAVPEGWWWWIGDGGEGGHATLLVDAEELQQRGVRSLLGAALAAARGPVRDLSAPDLRWATRATPRLQRSDRVLLLGDAAATVDPLSSQGVEKALASAEQAAAVLRTALATPTTFGALCAQQHRWERGLYAAHARTAAAFYARETRFAGAPFWARRQPAPTPAAALPAPTEPLVVDPAVVLEPVYERRGSGFVVAAGARHTGTDDTLVRLGHVPVRPLLEQFAKGCALDAAVARAGSNPQLFVLAPAAVREAMLWLWRLGWLTAAATAPR